MLSVCTYENSAETDPDQQQPHFFATGAINVLGVASVGSVVDFTESGGAFSMTTSAGSGTFEMGGSFAGLTDCSITGTAEVDVDTTVDMGILGTIPVEAAVDYTYTITIDGAAASAGASGGFSFGGVGFSIPAFSLSLSEDSLIGLLSDAVDQVTSAIEAYLGDYQQWLNWLAAGVIQGIDSAEQVGEVLAKTFGVDYDTIATSTQQTLKYTTDQVASALEGAGASADDAASVLINTLGCSADAAADAVADVFTGEHCDVTITPHSDATITPHADSSSHSDVVTTPHSDTTITPHSDHKTHCDAGPFGSSKIHTDIHSSHSDIPKVHADLGKNHGDIPATHDDIFAVHTDVET